MLSVSGDSAIQVANRSVAACLSVLEQRNALPAPAMCTVAATAGLGISKRARLLLLAAILAVGASPGRATGQHLHHGAAHGPHVGGPPVADTLDDLRRHVIHRPLDHTFRQVCTRGTGSSSDTGSCHRTGPLLLQDGKTVGFLHNPSSTLHSQLETAKGNSVIRCLQQSMRRGAMCAHEGAHTATCKLLNQL